MVLITLTMGLSAVFHSSATAQTTPVAEVDPGLFTGTIPVLLEKPVMHSNLTSLTAQETYFLDSLTANERQIIESHVDPPAIGIVRKLTTPVSFRIMETDLPSVGEATVSGGRLSRIDETTIAWTVMIRSAKADEIRLNFAEGFFPEGVRVNLFGEDGQAFTQHELRGQISEYGFYTTTIFADHVILQLIIPEESIAGLQFMIPAVVHAEARYFPDAPLTCFEDANCAYANGYADIAMLRESTAKINFVDGGSYYQCSGGLLNDIRAGDWQPFFLTANHCFDNQAAALTLEARFDYATVSCGGGLNPNVILVNGSNLIAENSQSDFTLVLLHENPGGVRYYLGWSAATVPNNETMHSVHHPNGTAQKYSRVQNKTSPDYTCTGTGTNHFHYTRMLGGQADHGSSGSTVVKSSGHVVGQMLGPCWMGTMVDCDFSTYYLRWGRFDVSYNNNNLQYWLFGGGASVSMSSSPSSSYNYGTVNVGSYQDLTVTVNNTGTVPNYLNLEAGTVTLTGTNAGDFSVIGSTSMYLSPGTSGSFTVRFSPSSPGLRTANFNIPHNADNISSPRVITLTGYGNPCSDIVSIGGCGAANTQTFNVSGTGSWYTSTNNPCGVISDGVEQVYSFVAPLTGTYSIEVTSTDGTFVSYMWKSGSCSSSGWTCIDDLLSTGTYGLMSMTGGSTYYILLDDRYTYATTHSFYIFYNPCQSITTISGTGPGNSKTYNGGGNGVWYTSSSSPCGYSCPGMERVYSFVPATTGLYNVVVTAASSWVDYMWKTTCASTGWTCIDDVYSPGTYGSMLMKEDTTYYILLDDENTTAGAHTFYLNLQEAAGNWEGMVSNDWYNSANWSAGFVPDATLDVTVNTGYTYYPIVASGDAYCNNISIGAGAKISVGNADLNIAGNMTIYGQAEQTHYNADFWVNGSVYLESGSTANITDAGEFHVSGTYWEFRNGSNAVLANGSVNFEGTSTQYIRSYNANNSAFYNVDNFNSSAYLYFISVSTDSLKINGYYNNGAASSTLYFNTNYPLVLKGQLYNSGHIYCPYGTFIFDGTTHSIDLNTGDYFNHLVISSSGNTTLADSLRLNGNLTIESGALVTGSYPILIGGNWTNSVGTTGFNECTGKVMFNGGNYHQYCSNETFYTLEVNKTAGGAFRMNGTNVTCSYYDWSAGAVDVLPGGGSFTANDIVDNGLYGSFYLNSGGTINLTNNDGWIDLNGYLYIYGGNFNVWGGSGLDSYWPLASNAGIEMTDGTLDIRDVGVRVYNTVVSLTENITGGTIRTSRGFRVERSDFTPVGGTVEFCRTADGNFYTTNGGYVNNVVVNKGGTDNSQAGNSSSLYRDRESNTVTEAPLTNTINCTNVVDIHGSVTIQNGTLAALANTISVMGDWSNLVGTSGFNEGTGKVVFYGANEADILTGETFYDVDLSKTYPSYNALELWQNVTVSNDLRILDGSMELNLPTDLFITGNLIINQDAGLNANDGYGPLIYVGKNWSNLNIGFSDHHGFDAGDYSTVYFNGGADQYLTKDGTEEIFNHLTIDKSSGYFRSNDNITCTGNMDILNGAWSDNVTSLLHTFYGNFTVAPSGAFYTSAIAPNTVKFAGSSNSFLTYSSLAGYFYSLTVDKSTGHSVTQTTSVSLQWSGSFTVEEGIYNVNGNYLNLMANAEINGGGQLSLPAGSLLVLHDLKTMNVNSGGSLQITGTTGSPVTFQSNISASRYSLNINPGGTIAAEYCTFKEMSANGVNVLSGATVDPARAFKGCTFLDGVAGGTLLRINNNQTLTVRNAIFPTNTWGGASNVAKTLNQGQVYFVDYSGSFAGELYDDDVFFRLTWVPFLMANATATPNSICAGSTSQLHANPSGGLPPWTYAWSPAGSLSDPFIENPVASPAGTTTYTVTVTDALGTTVSSSVTVTVTPNVPVSVTIDVSQNPVPPATWVTFTAYPVNGGLTPAYQWKVNEVNAGTGLPTYSYIPAYGDDVYCILTSSLPCVTGNPATSNTITMIVVPENTTVTGTVPSPLELCFDASNTITVAGGGSTFVVQSGGSAIMIAGVRILYLPGTTVQLGGYMHGYITTTNEYCGSLPPSIVNVPVGNEEPIPVSLSPDFIVYPNPTQTAFTLAQKTRIITGEIRADLYSLQGKRLFTATFDGSEPQTFQVADIPSGIYILKVVAGDHAETFKVIISR